MNIGNLLSRPAYLQTCAAFPRQTSAASDISAFVSGIPAKPCSETYIQGPGIHLRIKGENCVYSGGRYGSSGAFQNIYAEYTADSTADDPIVRISGTADSGAFDLTCHIRDIDPSHASYAELAALYGHLCHSGAYQTSFSSGVLPCGMECGDVTQKQDFISMLVSFAESSAQSNFWPKFGPTTYAHARELLEVYQGLVQNEPK